MRRAVQLLAALLAVAPLLACAAGGQLPTGTQARWACPSPTPKPWGEQGPVKGSVDGPMDPTTGIPARIPVYWHEWEQEHPEASGPPFPSPTPYGFSGTTFVLGQRVEVGALHVQVSASAGPASVDGHHQLYRVLLRWHNPTGAPVPIDYAVQLQLRAITQPDGRQRADGWMTTTEALEQAGGARLPRQIPAGESQTTIPILAPPGAPKTVELRLPLGTQLATPTPGTVATPTPNTELRRPGEQALVLQWTAGRLRYFDGPPCGDPGALTAWGSGPQAVQPVAAPAGAGRLIQILLAQVGKPYVWGAKGPERFDCSGLATWAYGQIGIAIPQGTAGQWPGMRAVREGELQPGDLVFFAIAGGGIDHVGLLVGDLNGNGEWDMVHAASPALGVRIDHDIFQSRYYQARIRGFRTAR